jgi:hypothetical protein
MPFGRENAVAFGLLGVGFLISGIFWAVQSRVKGKRYAEEASKNWLRCWGRILSVVPSNFGYSVGQMTWRYMEITVDAFAALDSHTETGLSAESAGTRVADRVVISWSIPMFQLSLVLPGNYCAFLLDLSDPTKVYLDALASPQGQIMPIE